MRKLGIAILVLASTGMGSNAAAAAARPADQPRTVEEVIDFYDKGGSPSKNVDEKIKKLDLPTVQKKDLVEFLRALDGAPIKLIVPAAFPD